MPDNKEHCNDSFKKYGYDFRAIHKWMDEPSGTELGPNHRKYRHNPSITPKKVENAFWDKVPEKYREYIKDAVLDHIYLDGHEDREIDEQKLYKLISKIKKDKISSYKKRKFAKEIVRIVQYEPDYEEFLMNNSSSSEYSMKKTIILNDKKRIEITKEGDKICIFQLYGKSCESVGDIPKEKIKEVSDGLLDIIKYKKQKMPLSKDEYDIIYNILWKMKKNKLISVKDKSLMLTKKGIEFYMNKINL